MALAGDSAEDFQIELARLYLQMLYGDVSLPVLLKGTKHTVETIPGHPWSGVVGGPFEMRDEKYRGPVVMIVGKLPGHDEAIKKRNLCGPSGQLLRQVLEAHNAPHLDRWYVTNLVRWPMPNVRSETLPQVWIKDCLPLLHQEFRFVRPDFVLCLGAEATKAVCGAENTVSNMIGRSVTVEVPLHDLGEEPQMHKMQVMAVTHPAAVLRTTELRSQFEATVGNFVQLVRGEPFHVASDSIRVHPVYTERTLAWAVDRILAIPGLKKIAVDAEWHGDYPQAPNAYLRTIQVSPHGQYAVVVVLHSQGGVPAFLPNKEAAIAQLRRLLDRDDVQIIGSFFNADLPWLLQNGLDLRHRFQVPPTVAELHHGEYAGGFDVSLAHHAYSETADYKLEVMATRYCGADRWDVALQRWKKDYCRRNHMSERDLEGYGACPDDILIPYAAKDAAYTRQLRDKHCQMLCADKFGNDCWVPYHTSMLAFPAFNEMGTLGVRVDRERIDELTDLFIQGREQKLAQLREELNWPDFNPRSQPHCVEMLFGEKYAPKIDKNTGQRVSVRPPGAISLRLPPIKATGKRGAPWPRVIERREEHLHTPCTDKEVCGILSAMHETARTLRDTKLLDHVLKSVLRPPTLEVDHNDEDGSSIVCDASGNRVYAGGIAAYIGCDNRVRSHFTQHKETGRGGSARPPLQNLGNRREDDYKRILGPLYKHKIRSFIVSNDGKDGREKTLFIEADLAGAELLAMAVLSRDQKMIEHCQRAILPDGHPDQYDIHSQIAVRAFNLQCEPTKKGIEDIGRKGMRVAAKNIIFGIGYGRAAEACARQAQEEGHQVSTADAQAVINEIFAMYPGIPPLQERLRERVYKPGWIRTCFGRLRRFIAADDEKVNGELERQALNFPMQSAVADAMSLALHHLYTHPRRRELGYSIVLQIHDAVVLEVPVRSVDAVYNEILPECMTQRVVFKACDLDGRPYKDSPDYRFGIDRKVCYRWGEGLTHSVCDAFGVDRVYGKPDRSPLPPMPTQQRCARRLVV
jgi:uracil-DNA glycosylase family 4